MKSDRSKSYQIPGKCGVKLTLGPHSPDRVLSGPVFTHKQRPSYYDQFELGTGVDKQERIGAHPQHLPKYKDRERESIGDCDLSGALSILAA
jgi:hypothetical protein